MPCDNKCTISCTTHKCIICSFHIDSDNVKIKKDGCDRAIYGTYCRAAFKLL